MDAKLKNAVCLGENVYSFPPEGGELTFEENGTVLGVKAKENSYIVMDATNLSDFCVSVLWKFWDGNGGPCAESIKMGLLPGLKTRLAMPVSAVLGGELFPRRTPGKLKTVVQGRPVRPERVSRFAVGLDRAPAETKLKIHALYMAEKEPDYPLEGGPLVDCLGQKAGADWPGKTPGPEEMTAYLRAEYEKPLPETAQGCGKYGGSLSKRFEPTGYFALQKDGDKYWLADPEGYAFFSVGPDCVGIGGDCNVNGIAPLCGEMAAGGELGEGFYSWAKANFVRAFGDDWYRAWSGITLRRLREWGANTVACWSDPKFIEYARTPYVHILHGFPKAEKYIFRDFPDVFDPEYAASAARWARQLESRRQDKYMIGYFMCNEPNWAFVDRLDIARMTLESREDFYSKGRLVQLLKDKYGDIAALNAAWETEFASFEGLREGVDKFNAAALADTERLSEEMIREFVRVPALALKETDPRHLNLGMRYAWLSSPILAAGKEYMDVFSFNCYRHDPWDSIENMVKMVDMPVMIGEFHFGALDRGLDATGIQAAASQEDRAKAYRRYIHRCAAHPMCLGAHYFQYADQPYLGRFDGENYQIGLVDVCGRPYEELTAEMSRAHREAYRIRMGEMEVTDEKPAVIESIFY